MNNKELLKKFIRETLKKKLNEKKELRKVIQKLIILEKEEDKEFSKYFGINVLNHEVLSQIKDDIHMATKSLGDNPEFIEYFKRYLYLYLSDLIQTELDVDDIENEISQIKNYIQSSNSSNLGTTQNIQEVKGNVGSKEPKIELDPENPEQLPIDKELLGVEDENPEQTEEDEKNSELQRILGTNTQDLESTEERGVKRQNLNLDNGELEDAKKQAIDLMSKIDDIIIAGYNKISDELNKKLFVRYLIINVMLHVDKAFNEITDTPPEMNIPGYESKKSKVQQTVEIPNEEENPESVNL